MDASTVTQRDLDDDKLGESCVLFPACHCHCQCPMCSIPLFQKEENAIPTCTMSHCATIHLQQVDPWGGNGRMSKPQAHLCSNIVKIGETSRVPHFQKGKLF